MVDFRSSESPGRWIRPSGAVQAAPLWGHVDGIRVGLHPIPGPRGLLRVFAPYLGGPHRDKLLNFVAIEPVPKGSTVRGFSELEHSSLDNAAGKRMWSTDSLADTSVRSSEHPARGIVSTLDDVERLSVFVITEQFDNGSRVAVEVSFRADRPHEVAFAATRVSGSVELDYCVLTATMGNYPRLRRVKLANETVTPQRLWPGFAGVHFTDHAVFSLEQLPRNGAGEVEVTATPDESDPGAASYAPEVNDHWKYVGKRASQTWTAAEPDPSLVLQLNARAAYWASTAPIPGGASFENFELKERFREGREFRLTIEPLD